MIDVVITIADDTYRRVMNEKGLALANIDDIRRVEGAIFYGIPLPKGHGRIGDLDALREEVSSWGMNDYEPSDFTDAIDQADTIIEADKSERWE